MKDLEAVFDRIMKLYETYQEPMPVLDEFVTGYRWLMSADDGQHVSLALRVGKEPPAEVYENEMRALIGNAADECIREIIKKNDETMRTVAVSILNLMSKPFNTTQRLKDRGITRTEGLNFAYPVEGKKVGIVGYGLYNQFFFGKCAEFHAFDFREEKGILSRRIRKDKTALYPEQIIWHLGGNALEHKEALEQLDIVIMTGCTIVNNTYREILDVCSGAQIRGIYGPSSELCPEYLFDLGYNYVFSASVKDKEMYISATCEALPDGQDLSYMNMYELVREGGAA